MHYARLDLDGQTSWARLDASASAHVQLLAQAPWYGHTPTGEFRELCSLSLRAPAEPSKIVAVGRNYADHASELGLETTATPRIFLKPPSSLVGPGDQIVLPPTSVSQEVHYEAELAVVIGTECRNISAAEASAVIFGYTCANDVTARDIQRRDGMPTFAKSFDSFCPLGPWIVTDLDPTNLTVRCLVNGETTQSGTTADMLTPVADLVAYISTAMTLLPGDVILTGTPSGVGPLRAGDVVTVEIPGIGELTNPVVASA